MIRNETHPHGEQLSAYIDSMLDVPRMRGIGEHLRGCVSCRNREADLRRTKHLVRDLPAPALPSADFWTSAYRQLRLDDRQRANAKRPLWTAWRSPEQKAHRRWAAGLAAAALAAFALSVGPLTPVAENLPAAAPRPAARPLVPAQDVSPDVSSLAELHTDSVSRLPLADPDRQKMIAADALEAAGYADASF